MAGTIAQGLDPMIDQPQELPVASPDLPNTDDILEETVTTLNKELELNPQNAVARQALYETMQQMLRKDAFLAYQNETNDYYIGLLTTRDSLAASEA